MQMTIEPKILDCGHFPSEHSEFTTGYGEDNEGKTFCYQCCADNERAAMIDMGKACLYLVKRQNNDKHDTHNWYVTDWPGKLEFKCYYVSKGNHNIARTRTDCWFNGPDGFVWHGMQFGENTQVCHCKRTKEKTR